MPAEALNPLPVPQIVVLRFIDSFQMSSCGAVEQQPSLVGFGRRCRHAPNVSDDLRECGTRGMSFSTSGSSSLRPLSTSSLGAMRPSMSTMPSIGCVVNVRHALADGSGARSSMRWAAA